MKGKLRKIYGIYNLLVIIYVGFANYDMTKYEMEIMNEKSEPGSKRKLLLTK